MLTFLVLLASQLFIQVRMPLAEKIRSTSMPAVCRWGEKRNYFFICQVLPEFVSCSDWCKAQSKVLKPVPIPRNLLLLGRPTPTQCISFEEAQYISLMTNIVDLLVQMLANLKTSLGDFLLPHWLVQEASHLHINLVVCFWFSVTILSAHYMSTTNNQH